MGIVVGGLNWGLGGRRGEGYLRSGGKGGGDLRRKRWGGETCALFLGEVSYSAFLLGYSVGWVQTGTSQLGFFRPRAGRPNSHFWTTSV